MTNNNIGYVTKTTDNLNLFVSLDGYDTNSGLNESEPLATIQAAIDRIPRLVAHTVIVNIGDGTFVGFQLDSRIIVSPTGTIQICGQLGSPELSSGTVSAIATGGSKLDLEDNTQSWPENGLRGFLLRVGEEHRVIRRNTSTVIVLAAPFSLSCAGMPYEILEQKTIIESPASGNEAIVEVRGMVCERTGYAIRDLRINADSEITSVLAIDTNGGTFERIRTTGGRYGFSFESVNKVVRPYDLFAEGAAINNIRFTHNLTHLWYGRLFSYATNNGCGIFLACHLVSQTNVCSENAVGPGVYVSGGTACDFNELHMTTNAGSGLKICGGDVWVDIDRGVIEHNDRYGIEVDGPIIDGDPNSPRSSHSCVNMIADILIDANVLGGVIGHHSSNLHITGVKGTNGGYGLQIRDGTKVTISDTTTITGAFGDVTMDEGKTTLEWTTDFPNTGDRKVSLNNLCLISRVI